jgi:hypothetical protein
MDGEGRRKKGIRIAAQLVPPPDWLFGLPERLAGSDVSIRSESGASVVAVWASGALRDVLGPLQEIEFGPDGLPVRRTTFGVNHQPQEDVRIVWSRRSSIWFPEVVTFTYPGRRNSMSRTERYTVVRVNAAIAATVFVP